MFENIMITDNKTSMVWMNIDRNSKWNKKKRK